MDTSKGIDPNVIWHLMVMLMMAAIATMGMTMKTGMESQREVKKEMRNLLLLHLNW